MKTQKGFTLIEFMVAMGVALIALAAGWKFTAIHIQDGHLLEIGRFDAADDLS